jgi:hypothetical protein
MPYCVGALNLEAFMAFHFDSPESAKAAIYDAALLILQADHAIALPIGLSTVVELSEVCRRIEVGEKLSRSPVLDL